MKPPEDAKGFWRFMLLLFAEFFNLISANLIFLVTAVGIVTIPAGLAGLSVITMEMMAGKGDGVVRTYFSVFRTKFLRLLGIGALHLFASLILGAAFLLYGSLGQEQNPFFYIPAGMAVLLELGIQMCAVCVYPVAAFTRRRGKDLFSTVLQTVRKHAVRCFAAAGICCLLSAVSVLLFPGSLIFVLFIQFSFESFIASFIMYPALTPYLG